MDDYLKNHSTDDNTVMASVEDYRYFLDELNELNMLVTRAADERIRQQRQKTLHGLPTAHRALRTDERKHQRTTQPHQQHAQGQQFGPQGGRISLDVTFQRQFEKCILTDWTRNETIPSAKAFNNCETKYTRQNTTPAASKHTAHAPRPTRTQLILRNRATTAPPTNIAPPAENPAGLKNSPHSSAAQPSSTSSAATSLPHTTLFLDKHSSKPTAATPNARSPYYPRLGFKSSSPPGKQNRGNPQRRQQNIRRIQRPIHRQLIPTGTRQPKPSHRTKHSPPPHPRNQQRRRNRQRPEHHQRRHPQPTQRIRATISPSMYDATPVAVAQNRPVQTSRTRSPLRIRAQRRSHPQLGTTTTAKPAKNQNLSQRNRPTNQPTHRLGNHTRPQHGPQHHPPQNTNSTNANATRTHHHQPIQPRLQHLHKHRQNPQNHDDTDFQPRHTNRTLLLYTTPKNIAPHGPIPGFSAKWQSKTASKPLQKQSANSQTRTTSPQRPPEIRLRLGTTPQPADLIVTQPWTDGAPHDITHIIIVENKDTLQAIPQQNTPSVFGSGHAAAK